MMLFSDQLMEELNLLSRINLSTTQEGVKVHTDAGEAVVAAAARLFDKGLMTQVDGGYPTSLGMEAAEHAQALLGAIKVSVAKFGKWRK